MHPGFLNFVFFKASPSAISSIGSSVQERIRGIRAARTRDLQVGWLPGYKPGENFEPALGPLYHNPRVYDLTGTFDVGAVFFSPELELSTWMQVDELRTAGHGISICLLPTAESLDLPLTSDFNAEFCRQHAQVASEVDQPLPAEQTFVAVIKVKVNPAVAWAEEGEQRLRAVLREAWGRIESWQAQAIASGYQPQVALGLGLGWSELLVVAHASAPQPLLELATGLRQAHLPLEGRSKEGYSHIAVTTITTLGFDFNIRERAKADLLELRAQKQQRGHLLQAADLIALATAYRGDSPTPEDHAFGCSLQVGFHTYPGHGLHLTTMLGELRDALQAGGCLGDDEPKGWVEIGKRDIWSPRIPLCTELPARCAFVLRTLIQIWVRQGIETLGPADAGPAEGEIPAAFDFYTRLLFPIETITGNVEEQKRVLDGHVRGLIPDLFSVPEIHKYFRRGHFGGTAPQPLMRRVRDQLRTLQVPYPISEQILTLLSTFFWVYDREELWDESVELIPVVLAFLSFLEGVESWWIVEGGKVPLHPTAVYRIDERDDAIRDRARNMLFGFLANDLLGFGRFFRSYFYSRHLSGYFTDEMPDFNFRYRGSVQQLLTTTNMVLDSLVAIVLGPRASMAVIDGEGSPELHFPCDITTVRLGTPAFRFPIMLETLGHEVGHQFVLEILRDGWDAGWRKHPWVRPQFFHFGPAGSEEDPRNDELQLDTERSARFDALRDATQELDQVVYLGRLSQSTSDGARGRFAPADYFIESTSDLIEKTVFGYDSIDQWAPGFMLRILLGGRPTWMDGEGGRGLGGLTEDLGDLGAVDVPRLDEDMVSSAVTRMVLAAAAETIQRSPKPPQDLRQFRDRLFSHQLESLRETLLTRSVLGDTQSFGRILASEPEWSAWIWAEVIPHTPWLRESVFFPFTVNFYRALDAYLQRSLDVPAPGPGMLWKKIRSCFTTLREGILESLVPSLYVRQWMDQDQHAAVRRGELTARLLDDADYKPYPWAAAPQPISLSENRKQALDRGEAPPVLPAFRTIVFQRGAVLPLTEEARTAWYDGAQRFTLDMLELSPSWRLLTLRKAEAMLKRYKPSQQ